MPRRSLCRNCAKSPLMKKPWDELQQAALPLKVIHTWWREASESTCALCNFIQREIEHVGVFDCQIFDVRSVPLAKPLPPYTCALPELATTQRDPFDVHKVELVLEFNGQWTAWKHQEYQVEAVKDLIQRVDHVQTRLKEVHRLHPKDNDVFLPILKRGPSSRCLRELVDGELVRYWMEQCEASHGSCCSPRGTECPSQLILIDIEEMRLFDKPPEIQPRYLALSYAWGNVQQPVLTESNGERWHVEGSLKEVEIPRTIRDAIQLSRMIGYRYLWVDALCIVQDNAATRHHQISQMHKIYQQADLTIIAADGKDCTHGLSGISTANDRVRRHQTYELPGVCFNRLPSTTRYSLDTSHWRTRGWTFQEELCSRRALTVLPELMIFTCSSAVWREDLLFPIGLRARFYWDPHEGPLLLASTLRTLSDKATDGNEGIPLFQDLVKQYTKRNLRRSDDIENAFAGVAGMLEPFLGPLYHGIPEQHFDEIVHGCWYWDTSLRRRPGFPSWSWTGWIYRSEQMDTGIQALTGMSGVLVYYRIGMNFQRLGHTKTRHRPVIMERSEVFEHFRHDEDAVRARHSEMQSSTHIPTHLIAFFTSIATLKLLQSPSEVRKESKEYQVVHPESGKHLTNVRLSPRFVNEAGLSHQFIVIARDQKMCAFHLMLVSFRESIAERVNVTMSSRLVSQDDWLSLAPRKELIVMG